MNSSLMEFSWSAHLSEFVFLLWSFRSSCSDVFCKKGVRPEACNFIKKETLAQLFSCEFCEISKNTIFTEHLWWLLLNSLKLVWIIRPNHFAYHVHSAQFFVLFSFTKICFIICRLPMINFITFYNWGFGSFHLIFLFLWLFIYLPLCNSSQRKNETF